jgi:hypothetical protein
MNTIQKLINELNQKFPTSYEDRFNHHINYFKKRTDIKVLKLEAYVKETLKNKEATYDVVELPTGINANARKTENLIQLSFNLLYVDDGHYLSGYKREQEFMRNNVKNHNQFVKWVICHEYCHLLYPSLGHTLEFYKKTEELYKQTITKIK